MTLARGAPQTSYTRDGIQRAFCLPAIDLLKSPIDVTDHDLAQVHHRRSLLPGTTARSAYTPQAR